MAQDLRRSQSNVPQSSQSGGSSGNITRRRGDSGDFFRLTPFQLMRHFSDEMDRMWSGYGQGHERFSSGLSQWKPVVDVRENNGQLQVHAELPGINENDVKVAVENDTLVIQGERKREEEKEEEGWYRAERSYGSFYRAIPLPEGVEADKANARFQNGVLEITMPLAQKQQSVRQIPISVGQTRSGQETGQQPAHAQQGTQEKVGRAGGS